MPKGRRVLQAKAMVATAVGDVLVTVTAHSYKRMVQDLTRVLDTVPVIVEELVELDVLIRRSFESTQPDVAADLASPISDDTVATLVEMARHGHEADFRWLATAAGIEPERVDVLWAGTRVRTRPTE